MDRQTMKTVQLALQAWREADRRIQDAGSDATPEMVQELACAKQRYQERVAELTAEGRTRVNPAPRDPYHDPATNASVQLHGAADAPRAAD